MCVDRPAAEIYNLLQDFSAKLGLGKCFLLTNKGAAGGALRDKTTGDEKTNASFSNVIQPKKPLGENTLDGQGDKAEQWGDSSLQLSSCCRRDASGMESGC